MKSVGHCIPHFYVDVFIKSNLNLCCKSKIAGRVKMTRLLAFPSPQAYDGLYIRTLSLVKRFTGIPMIYSSPHKHNNDSATDDEHMASNFAFIMIFQLSAQKV